MMSNENMCALDAELLSCTSLRRNTRLKMSVKDPTEDTPACTRPYSDHLYALPMSLETSLTGWTPCRSPSCNTWLWDADIF